jgi:tRNA pseudouridine65 synthase
MPTWSAKHLSAQHTSPTELRILHQDNHLVAVCKPPGMLVHRTAMDAPDTQSVARLLRAQLAREVFAVHRLDKGTSGVLLFALDAPTARHISRQFESGEVHKTYHAMVRGWPPEAGTVDHPLKREDEGKHHTLRRDLVQEAVTHFRTVHPLSLPMADTRPTGERFEHTRIALVELSPVTGRRHQLRRHMKHIAHPILGDATHGKGPLNRAVAEHLGLNRLWLHASCLEWTARSATDVPVQSLRIDCAHGFDNNFHELRTCPQAHVPNIQS